uniref:Uncharacterized protein n=1 Tax=Anguilla anguilla TaxID=7936 RepID=A0A0E9QEA8_ANGAN
MANSWSGLQRVLEPIPACSWQETGIHPGQVANTSQGTHSIHSLAHSCWQFRVLEQWENPH